MVVIYDKDADYLAVHAEFLARLARKWAAWDAKDGTEENVQSALNDILKILRGESLE